MPTKIRILCTVLRFILVGCSGSVKADMDIFPNGDPCMLVSKGVHLL